MFFLAVHQWLEHPHPHERTRDIGESTLSASDYEADLEGYQNNEEDDTIPERPSESDLEFIDDSEKAGGGETQKDDLDQLEEWAESATQKHREQKEQSSPKTKRSSPKKGLATKSPKRRSSKSAKKNRKVVLTQSSELSPLMIACAKAPTPDFLTDGSSSDGEASYEDPDEYLNTSIKKKTPEVRRRLRAAKGKSRKRKVRSSLQFVLCQLTWTSGFRHHPISTIL